MPAEWAGQPVLVRWQLKRPMYDFKNSFPPAFVYIHRAKYIFPEIFFAYPISEQKFTVCNLIHELSVQNTPGKLALETSNIQFTQPA